MFFWADIIFGLLAIMSTKQLARVLGKWMPYLPRSNHMLRQCLEHPHDSLSPPPRRYRLESAGSGVLMGTTTDPSSKFQTYKVYLGHGGPKIADVKQIPEEYDGPLVLCKRELSNMNIPLNSFRARVAREGLEITDFLRLHRQVTHIMDDQ